MNTKKALIVWLLLSAFALSAKAQQNLERLTEGESPGRVTAYFSFVPSNYTAVLSPDKKSIVINVKNCTVSESARRVPTGNFFSDIYSRSLGKDAEIIIELKDKLNYTCVTSIYAKALVVDVFKWSKLKPEEDAYRTGQMAFEDGIIPTAKQYLQKAFKGGLADAGVLLGIIGIRNNKPDSALAYLKRAESLGAVSTDLYGAMWQAYTMKSDNENADKYAKLFTQKTGIKKIGQVPTIYNDDSPGDNDTVSLLNALASDAGDSSTGTKPIVFQGDSSAADSALTRSDSKEFLSTDAARILFYVLIAVGLIGLMLATSYVKWRKQQLGKQNPEPSEPRRKQASQKAARSKKKAKTDGGSKPAPPPSIPSMPGAGASRAVNAYLKNDNISRGEDKNRQSAAPKPKPEPDGFDNLEGKLDMLAQKLIDAKTDGKKTKSSKKSKINKTDEEAKVSAKPKPAENVSPKAELAARLQKEQYKLKTGILEEIDPSQIPDDPHNLAETAKKKGVETSGLEIKKNLSRLEKGGKSLDELKSKFTNSKEK